MRPGTRVIVTRRLPAPVEHRLTSLFDTELNADDHPFSAEELRQALIQGDAVLCTVTDRIDRGVLSGGPIRARMLANFGVGYNHIDLAEARARGLVVSNTPGVLTDATADLAIALMLMAARRLGEAERLVRRGGWTGWAPTHLVGLDVSSRTLGIIGLGRIGQAVARRAVRGFGMHVLAYTPRPLSQPDAAALGVHQVSLDRVLAEADVVSIHAPATADTRHLINRERLGMMKPTAVLVNTARGDLVDESALADALRDGTIAAAGLDVYAREPAVPETLLALDNVVLLPHLGSATESTRTAMGMKAVDNLVAFFRGEPVPDLVGDK